MPISSVIVKPLAWMLCLLSIPTPHYMVSCSTFLKLIRLTETEGHSGREMLASGLLRDELPINAVFC